MFINTVLDLHLLVAVEIVVSQKASTYNNYETTRIFSLLLAFSHMQELSLTHNQQISHLMDLQCTAIASLITWEIDGVLINDGDLRDKGFDDSAPTLTLNLTQDLHSTSLRVLGSPDSNNVSITCLACNYSNNIHYKMLELLFSETTTGYTSST